jgi:hypothetical protein
MGVNLCGARPDDFGEYPGFRDPHLVFADLAIVFTFLKFGRRELPSFVTRRMFAAWGLLVFGAAYAIQWLFFVKFGAHDAARYAAFPQNTLMSDLFFQMILARRGPRGQSLTIAVAK